jgi:hypothetical protein
MLGRSSIQTKTLPPPAPLDALDEINEKKAKKHRPRRRASDPPKEPAPVVNDPQPPKEVVAVPLPPPPPFPTADDIKVGTPRNSLEHDFGAPYLKTTAVRRDGMVETWVYVQNQRNLATFAQVSNGRVISSHTTVY